VIPNWFHIILSRNPGIAFSFFRTAQPLDRCYSLFGSVLIIVLIAWLLWRDAMRAPSRTRLALLLGGAAGNLTIESCTAR